MAIEQVPQEEFHYHQRFNPPESPPQGADELNLIEKCLKLLGEKELSGGPYVQDYLHDQKRRNCRPNTIHSNFMTLMIFLSYLKEERGKTSLEPITREELSSFIEYGQDRGMQPNTVSTRLRHL